MDRKRAGMLVAGAWELSAIGLVLIAIVQLDVPVLGDLLTGAHLFLPWMFPGALAPLLFTLISALTYLLYRRSRFAAISILFLYVSEKVLVSMFLHFLTPLGEIVWLATAVLWAVIFSLGVWGTFTWHRASTPQPA